MPKECEQVRKGLNSNIKRYTKRLTPVIMRAVELCIRKTLIGHAKDEVNVDSPDLLTACSF